MRPRVSHRRPPGPAFMVAFLGAVALLAVLSPVALADALTPESGGSPNADRIDSLYKWVSVLAILVFLAVEGALIYALLKFRPGRGRVAAQIRGNTRLELGWTVGAALILVALTVLTFVKLGGIKDPAKSGPNGLQTGAALYASIDQADPPRGSALNIDVNGQQYVWRYTYPNGAFSYDEMVVPVNTTVTLDIRAQDVIHSWWIPKLGGKADAVPGNTNKTWFKIPKPGVYDGRCAELCGRNHANMLARVRAVPVGEYEAWVARQKADIEAGNREAQRRREQEEPRSEAPPEPQQSPDE